MTGQPREYETTHPWLTFDVTRQLERAPARFWKLLGGTVALAQVLADTPMLPEYADQLHRVYLVKGAVATTAIEGNTLSEEDVAKLLDHELELPPSKEYLGREVWNMIRAFNEIMEACGEGRRLELTASEVKRHNRDVLNGLELEVGVVPGEISGHSVVVGPYRGAPRRDCDLLLDRLCDWLQRGLPAEADQTPIASAILHALLAHLYLAWIHPFGDGNGRTARLVEFQILASGGIPGPAAHLLSNHFNDTRTEYYRQLNHASRSGGEVVPFLTYALQGFYDGLQLQLEKLREQTELLLWRQLVDQAISGHRPSEWRQRHLAIELFHAGQQGVRRGELATLSIDLARAYADKTSKTLSRDLGVLMSKGLVTLEAKGTYRASIEQILGMMPARAPRP